MRGTTSTLTKGRTHLQRIATAIRPLSLVSVPLPGLSKTSLFAIEMEVRRIAPPAALSWNDMRALDAFEPTAALDLFLRTLSWPKEKLDAIDRQAARWHQKQMLTS
jgi:hypothetical protein